MKCYDQFQAVIDTYIEKHFCDAAAYKFLVNQISEDIRKTTEDMSRSRQVPDSLLDDVLLVLGTLFEFIIKSAQLSEKLRPECPP